MGKRYLGDKRFCYACGSDKSWIDKNGQEHWLANKPTNLWICHRCRRRYLYDSNFNRLSNARRTKETIRITNQKRMYFKTRSIRLPENPRKGVCSWCNARVGIDCKKTHMHHKQYHDDDPLKDTVELCNRCHRKAHKK